MTQPSKKIFQNLTVDIPSSSSDNDISFNNKIPITPFLSKHNPLCTTSSSTELSYTDTFTDYSPPSSSSSYNSYHVKIYPSDISTNCFCINQITFNNLCNCKCSYCYKIHSKNKNFKISSRIFTYFKPLFDNFSFNSSFFITLTHDSSNINIYIFLDLKQHNNLLNIITKYFSLSFPNNNITDYNSIKNILTNLFFFDTVSIFTFSSIDNYSTQINLIKQNNNFYHYEFNSFI